MKSAIHIENRARGEGKTVFGQRTNCPTNVFRSSPTADWSNSRFITKYELIIFLFDPFCYISFNDTGTNLVYQNPIFGEAGSEQFCHHREAGLCDAIITAVN